MGFALPLCIEALFTSSSLIAATDFLLALGPNVLVEDINSTGIAGAGTAGASTSLNSTEQSGRPSSVELSGQSNPPNSASATQVSCK